MNHSSTNSPFTRSQWLLKDVTNVKKQKNKEESKKMFPNEKKANNKNSPVEGRRKKKSLSKYDLNRIDFLF